MKFEEIEKCNNDCQEFKKKLIEENDQLKKQLEDMQYKLNNTISPSLIPIVTKSVLPLIQLPPAARIPTAEGPVTKKSVPAGSILEQSILFGKNKLIESGAQLLRPMLSANIGCGIK